jgi:hypothetical protein
MVSMRMVFSRGPEGSMHIWGSAGDCVWKLSGLPWIPQRVVLADARVFAVARGVKLWIYFERAKG